MILGVDPKVDYAFKRLFGLDRNRDILISLLNAVLQPSPGQQVTDIQILNPFNPKETDEDKLSIVDIKAKDQQGRRFNVEMQLVTEQFLRQRLLYYWSKLYQQQLFEGEEYEDLHPTVSICFLNAALFPDVDDYHLRFHLMEAHHRFLFCDDIQFHLLQLTKFKKNVDDLATPLDRWLYFLKDAAGLDVEGIPVSLDVPDIQSAIRELKMITQSDMERELYEDRLKRKLDETSRTRSAQRTQQKLEAALAQIAAIEQRAQVVLQETQAAQQQAQAAQQQAQAAEFRGAKQGFIGQIHLAQRLLKRALAPEVDLLELEIPALRSMAEALEKELSQLQF